MELICTIRCTPQLSLSPTDVNPKDKLTLRLSLPTDILVSLSPTTNELSSQNVFPSASDPRMISSTYLLTEYWFFFENTTFVKYTCTRKKPRSANLSLIRTRLIRANIWSRSLYQQQRKSVTKPLSASSHHTSETALCNTVKVNETAILFTPSKTRYKFA
jgi:hypothetical protein